MKIVFKTLQSVDGVIQLSLDGGKNWTRHNIINIKEDGGIPIPEDQDLSLIKIKSDSTILKNLEVISSIGTETVVNMSHVDDLIVDKNLKLNKKDTTAEIDVLNTMVAPQCILQDRTMPLYSRNILNIDPNSVEDPKGAISIQNMFNDIPGMQSFGYYINSTNTDNYIGDPLDDSEITNFENISYEYHSYDEYLIFLNILKSREPILFDISDIAEGETKAIQGAHIEETDYILYGSKQNDNITLTLEPGDYYKIVSGEEMHSRIVFFKKLTVQKIETEYSSINLNGTTLDFASCKQWKQLSLDTVNKFIDKYDSENDILYSLVATTNNENVPEELRYSMIVYLNYSADGSLPNGNVPYDVWFSENDDSGVDTYSFNFEFNDNIEDYMSFISLAGEGIWTTDDEGNSFAYALTSADKKGYKFTKESDGTITSEPFNFSTIKEYTPAMSFVKKDSYSLYKSEIAKKSQIKIEGQLPKEDGIIFVNDKGEPSFITISELKTKLGIK